MDAEDLEPQTECVVYDASLSLSKALEAVRQGQRLLCPVCRTPLLVALDEATFREAKVHPGEPSTRNGIRLYATNRDKYQAAAPVANPIPQYTQV